MTLAQTLSSLAIAAPLLLSGCSIKQVAYNAIADGLSDGTGGSFTQDPDLEFIGEALPFALKLMESIGDNVPKHVGMKLTLASGFTQYGIVFVEWPAAQQKYDDYPAYERGLVRARGFYNRANDYALDALDLLHPGFRSSILRDTTATLAPMTATDVPFLFWLSASWLAAATTDLEDPEMFAMIPLAAEVMHRAHALDPGWDDGFIASTLIALEPVLPGPGGTERAQAMYDEALRLGGPEQAGPHVSLATALALPAQDKERFVALLELALAVDLDKDPDARLGNDYAQRKARFLLDHLDDLFL